MACCTHLTEEFVLWEVMNPADMLGDAQHQNQYMLRTLLIQQASVLHFFSLEVSKRSFVTDFTICQVLYPCLIGFNPLLLRPMLMFRMSRLI